MEILRTCRVCNLEITNEKDLELFIKGDRSKYGRDNLCKGCAKQKNEYHLKHDINNSVARNRIRSRRYNRKKISPTEGTLYVISHPCFNGWYKVGKTIKENINDRLNQYNTYSPYEYVLEFSKKVDDTRYEGDVIDELCLNGVENKGEWLFTTLDIIVYTIENIENIVSDRDKMTVDYFATLTEAEQVELTRLRAEAREFIRTNEGEK